MADSTANELTTSSPRKESGLEYVIRTTEADVPKMDGKKQLSFPLLRYRFAISDPATKAADIR